MGRKGIGRRKKAGTVGSETPASKRRIIPRDEERLRYYSAQHQRKNRRQNQPSSKDAAADADDVVDDPADDPADGQDLPPVLQLKTVVVGKE